MKFGRALREVVRFEVLYKLFVLCLVNPAMREIYQTYVSSVGVSFNAQMLGTFLNLKGGLLFLALFFLSALLVFYELSVVVNIVALCREGTPFRLRTVLKASVWNLGAMRGPGIIPAALYYVLFLPHVRLGYVNTLVPSVTIPEFIFDAMRRTPPLGQIGMILYNVLVYAAFLLLLFVPVRMVLRRERFGAAVRGGLSCWKQLGALGAAQVIAVLFIWNQGMTEIARFWRRNPLENSDFDGNFLKFLVYSEAFRKDLVYWVLMAVLLSAGMAAFLYVVLRRLSDKTGLHPTLYPDWQGDGGVLLAIAVRRLKGLAARVRAAFKKKRWKAAAGAAGLLFAAYLVLGLWQPPLVHAPLSIGHRGCNLEIENTVEAVLAADADGMDYGRNRRAAHGGRRAGDLSRHGPFAPFGRFGQRFGLHLGRAAGGRAARRIQLPRQNRAHPFARGDAAGGAGCAERHRPFDRAEGRHAAAGTACRGGNGARRAVRFRQPRHVYVARLLQRAFHTRRAPGVVGGLLCVRQRRRHRRFNLALRHRFSRGGGKHGHQPPRDAGARLRPAGLRLECQRR